MRPDEIVKLAAALRWDYYEQLGVASQSSWEALTDAQKLGWLAQAHRIDKLLRKQ